MEKYNVWIWRRALWEEARADVQRNLEYLKNNKKANVA